MKLVFWFLCAIIAPLLIGGSLASVSAQTSSPTPDPFTVQLTSSPLGFNSTTSDISANGRFVVFTSNGDVATQNKNNADGNREIFIADYAQRRIFQITNTKHVLNPVPTPSPTPTPSPSPSPTASPSPTPTPGPTPVDLQTVKIEIDNRAPMISLSPGLSGGQRVYTIVFSSNAPNPGNFDGTEGNLANDGNSEIWIYRLPAVSDVDLTLGTDLPLIDLSTGTFTPVTNTPASRVPRAGGPGLAPFFADVNREATISDDGNILAFISTRNLVTAVGNADGNPELFLYTIASGAFTQATNTQDATVGIGLIFQSNPNLSSDGSVVSFMSSANLATNNADNNAEIFIANFGGGAVSNLRQVTRTLNNVFSTNVLSAGRRMSRNGGFIAFESHATDPKANTAPTNPVLGLWVYTVGTDTFNEVGTRPPISDFTRFPMFTDYNASLVPSSLVFESFLNFRPDGTFPTSTATANEGINTDNSADIFITQVPVSSSNTFARLTNVPVVTGGATRPMASESHKRIAFSMGGAELGGGNGDLSTEIFYLLTPIITSQSSAPLSFFTGASNMAVAAATPIPSPTPSPTPTPSPVPGTPAGLAAGQLSIVRSTIPLAPSDAATTGNVTEGTRSPVLPVELNGVSVSVNGAAAGLYFVRNADKQINFVMPIGLNTGLGTVAVNILDTAANSDTLLRGNVQIIAAQPDIFTTTMDAGGRAIAFNVTNGISPGTPEPFDVTTGGNPTVIELWVTGIRFTQRTEITVTVGTTVITTDVISVQPNTKMPGFDLVDFALPASLAGAGDVPIQVTFTRGTISASSRPADSAPHITIN